MDIVDVNFFFISYAIRDSIKIHLIEFQRSDVLETATIYHLNNVQRLRYHI